jgi:hypothetical protein
MSIDKRCAKANDRVLFINDRFIQQYFEGEIMQQ